MVVNLATCTAGGFAISEHRGLSHADSPGGIVQIKHKAAETGELELHIDAPPD